MGYKSLKPIPTKYHGIEFRSKLEAQWAVYFDEIGVDWEYEPEGFDLGDGIWYLPDFKIHNTYYYEWYGKGDLFVEVKGVLDKDDQLKIKKFLNIKKYPRCDGKGYYERIERPLLILGKVPRNFKEAFDMENISPYLNKKTINGTVRPIILGIDKEGEIILTDDVLQCDWDLMLKALDKARNYKFDHRKVA